MIRTQISLTEEQKRMLEAQSAETGLSQAALIRQAIDRCFDSHRSVQSDLEALAAGYAAWSDRKFDGAGYVERLRSGRRTR